MVAQPGFFDTDARLRAEVEDVFAAETRRMGLRIRTIGLAWASAKIALANLTYNMRRLVWIERRTASE
jgi:transposase, IS5 family